MTFHLPDFSSASHSGLALRHNTPPNKINNIAVILGLTNNENLLLTNSFLFTTVMIIFLNSSTPQKYNKPVDEMITIAETGGLNKHHARETIRRTMNEAYLIFPAFIKYSAICTAFNAAPFLI